MLWFRRIWNIFAQLFVFAVVGFSKCKSYLNEREECYGRQIYSFNPRKMEKKKLSYIIISENTLQEMLSNPYKFVSDMGIIICFGR